MRARVDYQSLQQQLIVARNALEKDKLALARTIGLPLAQSFTLTDKTPFSVFDQFDVNAAITAGARQPQGSCGNDGAS